MRTQNVGKLAALASLLALAPILTACAAEDADPAPARSSEGTEPSKVPSASPPKAGGDAETEGEPVNECTVAALSDVADVSPTFVTHAPPAVEPPAMTGGALAGSYVATGAVVYLPSGAAGVIDPEQSTGSINAWAVFDGARYRIHLKADFTIATVAGPQSQGVDTESQGGFTVTGPALSLDHACSASIADEADYTFTDHGESATILVRTSTPYGDTFLELDAAKIE